MNTQHFHTTRLLPLLGIFFFLSLSVHAQNEIVQNDDAVLLRNIWMIRGATVGGDEVGNGAGSVGFVNNDSIADFAVRIGITSQWQIFYGGSPDTLSTRPAWTFDNSIAQPPYPVPGQFWGEGRENSGVGFMRREAVLIDGRTRYFHRFYIHRNTGEGLADTAAVILDPEATIAERLEYLPRAVFAVDLDGDSDDELVVVVSSTLIDQSVDRRAEIWIFEGGAGFQLDSPTVVLKDTEENATRFGAMIGNLDGDPYPDIVTFANYQNQDGRLPDQIKFWWGKASLSSISTQLDYSVALMDPLYPRIGNGLTLVDCDGDGIKDIWLPGPDGRFYLYRMGIEEKDPRQRLLSLADADAWYKMNEYSGIAVNLGPMNDPKGRYEMIGVMGTVNGDPGRLGGLSGGKLGPNNTIDAIYSAGLEGLVPGGVFGFGRAVGDASGNGYEDYLAANPFWHGGDQGIAILLEGGPYIPNDDTTLSIHAIATDYHETALHIWPNPVADELHIAWRGDLKSPPAILRVFDLNGRQIVEGDVEDWRGEALWRCGDVTSGTYLLVIYDRHQTPIARARIVKQQ